MTDPALVHDLVMLAEALLIIVIPTAAALDRWTEWMIARSRRP